jgi:putative ABC transport system permease protein
LIGIGGAYALSSIAPHTNPAGGGGGSSSGPSPHIDPIFIPRDLVHAWLLSLLLRVAAGIMPAWKASRLSPLFDCREIVTFKLSQRSSVGSE